MKYNIFTIAAFVAAFISCSKQESPVAPRPAELTLTIVSTKAFTETVTDTLMSQGFDAGVIFDNGTKALLSASQHLTWDGTVFKFASSVYAPITDGKMTVCGAYPFSPAVTSSGATLALSQNDIAFEKDVVACCDTVSTPISGSVALSFRHILSRVSVEAVAEDDDYDYRVTKCVISSPSSGTYDLMTGTWGGLGADTAKVTCPVALKGAGIQHSSGNIYSASEWTAGGFAATDAIGVAISDGTHGLLLNKVQGSSLAWSNDYEHLIPDCYTTTVESEADVDFAGKANTDAIIAAKDASIITDCPAADWCRALTDGGLEWYFPAGGEALLIMANEGAVNECMNLIGGIALPSYIWTSTQYAEGCAWFYGTGYRSSTSMSSRGYVRGVAALDYSLEVTTTPVTVSSNLCVIPCDAVIALLWECRDKTTGELERTVSGTGTVTARAGEHAVCRVTVGAE